MGVTRVKFRERQRLEATDLRTEQEYRLGMAGRHHLAPHDWGVIRGLRVTQLDDTRFRLSPGIAIDGYGRELLVSTRVDFEAAGFDSTKCWSVQLHYCEDPEQVPPGRECKDAPAPRIRQRTAIRVTPDFFPPGVSTDLATARAAGTIAGEEPWPVLVAQLGHGCGELRGPMVNYDRVRYVRHRAASIHSPTRRADIQLGQTSLTDNYHFLLSTRRDAQHDRRLGIDRDGETHVWRTLRVSGALGVAEALLSTGYAFRFRGTMPAGLSPQLRIIGEVDPNLELLTAHLVAGSPTLLRADNLPAIQTRLERGARLDFPGVFSPTISLFQANAARSIYRSVGFTKSTRERFRKLAEKLQPDVAASTDPGAAVPAPTVPAPLALQFSASFSAEGGMLSPAVVLFRPAAKIDPEPLAREIHAVVTSSDDDPVLRTELRICGGEADDSDPTGRVSVGARKGADHVAALRMDGGGRIRLLSGPAVKDPEKLLDVSQHTVYLPPVGKKDAMLPDLLALAFISGHMQIGNVTAAPKVELAAVNANGVVYKVKVSSIAAKSTFKSVLELICGNPESGPADMTVRSLSGVTLEAGNTTSKDFDIEVPGLAPKHRKVAIVVVMLVEIDGKTRALRSNILRMEIP